jgi:uncharacterized protein (DUF1015 family)
MSSIEPFQGRLIRPEMCASVVSPAFDSLSVAQRRRFRQEHPDSYLNVTRSAADEPDADTVDTATLVARGRAALERLLAKQVFASSQGPAFHIYRIAVPGHAQIGLVGEVDPHHFAERALPHESTQADRAQLLPDHFQTVAAASSPIACTIHDAGALEDDLRTASQTEPVLDFTADDGVHQTVWRVDDPELSARLRAHLDGVDLYIIDGHHRAAASKELIRDGHAFPVLVTVFPARSLHLEGFHRFVKLPENTSERQFIDAISRRFRVTDSQPLTAVSPGQVAIHACDGWQLVHFDERPIAGGPLVRLGSLEPAVLQREILTAILGGRETPVDVTYMPSSDGFEELAQDAHREGRVPIFVPPVAIEDLFIVAKGGLVMPAKSTYFTPKVRSGIFLREYDRA